MKSGTGEQKLLADQVWSTIPVTLAAKMMTPAPPSAIQEAIDAIDYRAMVAVYIQLDVGKFHDTDAHYFPEENVLMTRLSEPKNYYGHTEPSDSTILCAEIPCSRTDEVWSMGDEALGEMLVRDMAKVDLHVPRPPVRAFSRRLPQAYPIYPKAYVKPLAALDGIVDDGRHPIERRTAARCASWLLNACPARTLDSWGTSTSAGWT